MEIYFFLSDDFAVLPVVIDITVKLLDETHVLKVCFVYLEKRIKKKRLNNLLVLNFQQFVCVLLCFS